LIVRKEKEEKKANSNHFSFTVVICEMDFSLFFLQIDSNKRGAKKKMIMMMLFYGLQNKTKKEEKKGFKLEKMSETNKKSISFK
jgi:hypothetical protein